MAGLSRRQISLLLGAAGIACGALVWQFGPLSKSLAEELWEDSSGAIGEFYSHDADEYPGDHLGDVDPRNVDPRSLGDVRVRQFDELDRPRFTERNTHRGTQVNSERFTVVSATGDEDAKVALQEFTAAWNEFGRIADTFTQTHRNPDFALGQILIVIQNEPSREPDQPQRVLQVQNGQTIVTINVAEGEPSLEEQLPQLHQAAVHALMHIAELDRKFPEWVQQGLAQYTAHKLDHAREAEEAEEKQEVERGLAPEMDDRDDAEPSVAEAAEKDTDGGDDDNEDAPRRAQPALAGMAPAATEYWRLKRSAPDELERPDEEDVPEQGLALSQVKFLLEGDDAEHAPEFLLALREMAETPTDLQIASREHLQGKQLLPPVTDSPVDELMEELHEAYTYWHADPLRGQPLLMPGGEISDPAMLAHEKEMEVVLKLALRATQIATNGEVQPRITEFTPDGQREAPREIAARTAINITELYHQLLHADEPWATVDARGQVLLWSDEERLADVLGVEEHRYTTAWRDGHWVLVAQWDESTKLEAWLEQNVNNPSRPLVKFAAHRQETAPQIVVPPPPQRLPAP